ncbi:MAG: DNA repair protein RecN [Bacteroidota bacterium]
MLKRLFVKNYILIDELDISFDKGMSVITGETGAGKSILLGALELILGQRADSGTLLHKKSKCIIEGTFQLSKESYADFFTRNDLDFESETHIRREITPEGKSRAFINDSPVNLTILKELSQQLVDIHSQHETMLLNSGSFQLQLVDAYAKNHKQLINYKSIFSKIKSDKQQLETLKAEEAKGKADLDYFNFQLTELGEALLNNPEEQSQLEQDLEKLENAEEIKEKLFGAYQIINGGETTLLSNLKACATQLQSLIKFDTRYQEFYNRLNSSCVELKDIADELEDAANDINADSQQLQIITERLNLIYRLQQKHRVSSINELMDIEANLAEKVTSIGSLQDRIEALEKNIILLNKELVASADILSANRKKAIPKIENEINKMLVEVAMPAASIKIDCIDLTSEEFTSDGGNQIKFLFTANKGGAHKEISKVASGGELSRLMLCIKAMMAELSDMPTVIFDEIDTGISGETAAKVGSIVKRMSENHQVIAITHLPQMAGKGHHHYFVFKTEGKDKTHTSLKLLNNSERIHEIARMLSGEQLTEAAINNAKALIAN